MSPEVACQVMKKLPGTFVEFDGELHEIISIGDLSDAERAAQDIPPRGTKCACDRCTCENEGDSGTIENPICGCCRADCPDVHPDAEINAK